MIYLNNAATSWPKPSSVCEAVQACLMDTPASVRPARTLFLKVKVLSVPVSGKRIVNMARVSTVKWNLKEA